MDACLSKCQQLIICIIILFTIAANTTVFAQNISKTDSIEQLLLTADEKNSIILLDQLSKSYLRSNTEKSLESSNKMLDLSLKNGDYFHLQKAMLNCSKSYYYLSELDSVLFYANSAIQMDEKSKNDTVIGDAYMLICNANIIRGNYDVALQNGEKALELFKKIHDTLEIATAKKNLSYIFKSKGKYKKALEYSMEALKIFEASHDTMRIASGLGTIANIYLNTGKINLAKEYFIDAQKILIYQQNTLTYSQVLQAIAGIYRLEGKNDSSLYLFDQALTIAEEMNNPLLAGKINMNMANTLKADNQIDNALLRYKKAEAIFIKINSEKDINHINYSLGETYLQAGLYDSAEIYLMKSFVTSKKINHALIYEGSLNQLYLLYEEIKNYKEAYLFHKLYVQFHDSIVGKDVQVKIAELETKYETAKKDQQIIELELQKEIEESEKINQRIIFTSVIFLFLLVFLGIWQKRKKDRMIHRQKELYHKKDKQLAQSELEKSKIKEDELQQSVIYKSKQLSTHALHMMQKNSMLQEMQNDLKALAKKASTDDKPYFKRINLQILQSLRSHKDWDVFKLYFEDVNRDFYHKLDEINSDLTTNDHRLCALIKLSMNSKEMASVLNVAPNSIKSSRYRLKKKLGLDVDSDLEEFIRAL